MLQELSNKDADIRHIAEKALQDNSLLSEILDCLNLKEENIRYNCTKVLTLISEEHGEHIYARWDYFAAFLKSKNSYHKMSAIIILANLAKVDEDRKFEKIFDLYYQLLNDKSMIVAYYASANSGKIAGAKPELEPEISSRLLDIDKTHHSSDRRDLIKAGIIEAFSEYYDQSSRKDKIIDFMRQQDKSSSPKARKLAAEFLKNKT